MSKKSSYAPLSSDELRLCARKGAIAHLEELAGKVRAAFPELHVAVMVTDARFAPPRGARLMPPAVGTTDLVPVKGKHRRPRSAAFRAKAARIMRRRWRDAKKAGKNLNGTTRAAAQ